MENLPDSLEGAPRGSPPGAQTQGGCALRELQRKLVTACHPAAGDSGSWDGSARHAAAVSGAVAHFSEGRLPSKK